MSSFNRMYESFKLFSDVANRKKDKLFIQLSAGANWLPAGRSLTRCLHNELDSELTYRNYGRSAGAYGVTTALEQVEDVLSSGRYRPAVTVTNGTTEGARLVFELLFSERRAQHGDVALMVGHGFPLYSHLSARFGLNFREVLCDTDHESEGYLPSMDRVIHQIENDMPTIVFLIVPNNPIGERYSEVEMSALVRACSTIEATLLVDRVCLMPWDDYCDLGRAVAPALESGRCFVVDSFSKSESLAGLRTGFVVSNHSDRDRLIELTRAWWLNPVVFSTLTLALSRIAMITNIPNREDDTATLREWGAEVIEHLINDCASRCDGRNLQALFTEFQEDYRRDLNDRHQVVSENYRTLCDRFGAFATRPMKLDAGFNVAVTLQQMIPDNEASDLQRLANDHGVGLLTESCFRNTKRTHANYFVRIGLTLPPGDFQDGLKAMGTYFDPSRHYCTPVPQAGA